MPGGYWVEQSMLEEAWSNFWSGAQVLDSSKRHKAENLCADPRWSLRRRGERLKLGRCFKYFATHAILPITLANAGRSGPRKYLVSNDLCKPLSTSANGDAPLDCVSAI